MAQRTVIQVDTAPKPLGAYSQAIKYGNFFFLAGQIALDPQSGQLVGKTVEEQTRQCIRNLQAILESTGASLASIVKTTVYLKRREDFQAMNQAYEESFNFEPPARSTVVVADLPGGALVEIEAIAGHLKPPEVKGGLLF